MKTGNKKSVKVVCVVFGGEVAFRSGAEGREQAPTEPPFDRFPFLLPDFFPDFSRIFLDFSLTGTGFFGPSLAFFSGRSPSPQERLLGLQGGGTGAGGGDSEENMLASLAPEGTREWHDRRSGLPAGATKTVVAGQYEQVGGYFFVILR